MRGVRSQGLPNRDFMKERRRQLMLEKLERWLEKVFPGDTKLGRQIKAKYCLLRNTTEDANE